MGELTQEQQRFVDKVDAGESVWEDTEPAPNGDVAAQEPAERRIAVRLSAEQWEMLYAVAKNLGISPAVLSRMWILERVNPLYAAMTNEAVGWRLWGSRNLGRDEGIYRRMLAGEPEPAPTGAAFHRLRDEGYEIGWDKGGRGFVVVDRTVDQERGEAVRS